MISLDRSSDIEVNSADSAVMETVKFNMTNNVPFQLLYCGVIYGGGLAQSLPISIHGIPLFNMFTLYVSTGTTALSMLSINKATGQKWMASVLK